MSEDSEPLPITFVPPLPWKLGKQAIEKVVAYYEEAYRISSSEMLEKLCQGEYKDSLEHQLWGLYVLVGRNFG